MKIYVGNMPFSMTENDLTQLFAQFGNVESVNIIMDRETNRPRGFGFVEMEDAGGREAISSLAGHSIDGRSLNINEARPRENRGGGGGGRRGGGGGGRW